MSVDRKFSGHGISRMEMEEGQQMSAETHRMERRGAQRFEMHLPLAVHFAGATVPGFTQDLSGRGIFFYAETVLPEGAAVELTFTMPSEITLAESMPIRCGGRVLRACASAAERSKAAPRTGIAVQLESYQYLPSDEPTSQFVRLSAAGAHVVTSAPAPR
jgi:hypothetical protein